MAKKREGPVQALTIALIIFVMCTFVLAITTYVFYAQFEDKKKEAVDAKEAEKKLSKELVDVKTLGNNLLKKAIGMEDYDFEAEGEKIRKLVARWKYRLDI